MNDRIKNYVIPHIPYLFVFWFCLKLGTAYRLADGDNIALQMIGMMQTIGKAFSKIAPGLNASDWLVGIIGAVAIRLVVLSKSKKAENSERTWNTARHVGVRKKTSKRL